MCEKYDDERDLHVLTHSFPTRRASDLRFYGGQRAWRAVMGGDQSQVSARWHAPNTSQTSPLSNPDRSKPSGHMTQAERGNVALEDSGSSVCLQH